MMKFVVAFLVLTLTITSVAAQCRNDCYDKQYHCSYMKGQCENNRLVRASCPLTCGTCKSCITPVITKPCELGTCVDAISPILCQWWKQQLFGCYIMRHSCKATCGLCVGCELPPECIEKCFDKHDSCAFWKKGGYCNTKKGFPHVRTVCALTCGECTPCPTGPPNTALPPTKEEASKSVKSSNATASATLLLVGK